MIKDTTPMPFGKHRGKMLGEIPADYMIWLLKELEEQNKKSPFIKELINYLKDNIEYYKQQIG